MTGVEPVLSVKNIYCGYQQTEVVQGVSFDVFPREKLCILGPNGCGKTTLLRAVDRLLPFRGEVRVCGQDISGMKRVELADVMVYMSQMSSVYFAYSVYETVLMGRYAHHRGIFAQTDAQDRESVEESLRQTGTWELRNRLITELSGGQLQRVMLARIFAQSPDIILLDEPMNHLDLKYQIELTEYLDKWVGQGERCVVSVLHDINMAFSFADSILLMEDGRCVVHAPAGEFPIQEINRVYGMDIGGYMRKSLGAWTDTIESTNAMF